MDIFRKGLRVLERIEISIAMALFVVIVFSICAQVVFRYVLGSPLVWVEEAATYAFIWIVFLGAAVGMKRLSHIKIEALSLAMPVRAQGILRLFGFLIMGFVLWRLLLAVPGVMAIEGRSMSVSLPIPVPRSWFYSMPLYVSTISMALTLLYYSLAQIISLVRGTPMTFIDRTPVTEAAREGI
ncbi:TRAP transporter small permease [Arsenicitalea aurantiaca]|nr:TRAP transporter small permease [Arsenicitalea aurantiaca]